MKKKLPITTIFISGLIVILSYYAYNRFVSPILANSEYQTETIQLDKQSEIVLRNNKNTSIFTLEIEISGEVAETLKLELLDSIHRPIENILLKKGKINFMYRRDWYQNEANIRVLDKNTGRLTIKYRFIGLN